MLVFSSIMKSCFLEKGKILIVMMRLLEKSGASAEDIDLIDKRNGK